MKTNKVQFMTQAAMIAAIYVVLCVVFQPISYGPIQTRIAEALTVLPFFTSAAIPGLFVGCLIANVLGGGIILDVIAGSVATLIIPWVLKYGYGEPLPIPFMMGTVALGEILTATIIGTILLLVLDRYRSSIFKTAL